MPDRERAYWLLADDTIPLGRDPASYGLLRAALFHTLLYEPAVVVSDADIICNRNLRRAIREDDAVRELVRLHLLEVACRTDAGRRVSLLETRRDLFEDQRHPDHYPEAEFLESEGLSFVDENGFFHEFSLPDIAQRYTRGMEQLLASETAERLLGSAVAAASREVVAEVRAQAPERPLKQGFFYYHRHFGRLLDARLGSGAWERKREEIRALAAAPYITALPSKIGASPVYANEHRQAIEIWRGSLTARPTLLDEPLEFRSRVDLTTYVRALNALRPDDLAEIRQRHGGWKRYRAALRDFSERDEDLKELRRAYLEHRNEVEQLLVLRLGLSAPKPEYPVTLGMRSLAVAKEAASCIVMTIVDGLLTVPVLGTMEVALRLTKKLRGRDPETQAIRVERDRSLDVQAAIEEARAELESTEGEDARLRSETRVFGSEDRDTFLRSAAE